MPMAGGLHAALRVATKGAHRALDHHPVMAGLLQPDLQVSAYAQALAALHAVYVAADTVIARAAAGQAGDVVWPGYEPGQQQRDLEADLADLGVSPWPLLADCPWQPTPAQALGLMYVLLGSGLGGQFIARYVAALPHNPGWPLRFFTGYGGLTQQRWADFWVWAEAQALTLDRDAVTAAALALFASLHEQFDAVQARSPADGPVLAPGCT